MRSALRSRIRSPSKATPSSIRRGCATADEFVRHKALDAVGDLSLAGRPIIGLYRTYRPGHKLNALALEALFERRSAYEFLEAQSAPVAIRARVGGAHVPAGAAAFAAAD